MSLVGTAKHGDRGFLVWGIHGRTRLFGIHLWHNEYYKIQFEIIVPKIGYWKQLVFLSR